MDDNCCCSCCCFGRRVLGLPEDLLVKVVRQVRMSALRAMLTASKKLSRAARLGITEARLGYAFSDAVDLAWLGSRRQLSDAFPGLKTIELDAAAQMRVADRLVYEYECVDLLRGCRDLSVNGMPSARVVLPGCHDLLRLELRFDCCDSDTYNAVMYNHESCKVPLDSLTKLTALRCTSNIGPGRLMCDTFPASLTDLTVEFCVDPSEVSVLGRRLTNLRRLSLVAEKSGGPRPRPRPRPQPTFQNLQHFTCLTDEHCDDEGMAFLARAMPPSLESLVLKKAAWRKPSPWNVTDLTCWTKHCPRLSAFTFALGDDAPVPNLHLGACIAGMSCLARLHVCGNRANALLVASLERLRGPEQVVVDEEYAAAVESHAVASGARWKVRGTYPDTLWFTAEDRNVRIFDVDEDPRVHVDRKREEDVYEDVYEDAYESETRQSCASRSQCFWNSWMLEGFHQFDYEGEDEYSYWNSYE